MNLISVILVIYKQVVAFQLFIEKKANVNSRRIIKRQMTEMPLFVS
jgi:hypothetical protein